MCPLTTEVSHPCVGSHPAPSSARQHARRAAAAASSCPTPLGPTQRDALARPDVEVRRRASPSASRTRRDAARASVGRDQRARWRSNVEAYDGIVAGREVERITQKSFTKLPLLAAEDRQELLARDERREPSAIERSSHSRRRRRRKSSIERYASTIPGQRVEPQQVVRAQKTSSSAMSPGARKKSVRTRLKRCSERRPRRSAIALSTRRRDRDRAARAPSAPCDRAARRHVRRGDERRSDGRILARAVKCDPPHGPSARPG